MAIQFALIYQVICQYRLQRTCGWHISLALCCTLFLSSPFTDQGYRWLLSAIRCCVADVTAFIVTMIYWFRMTTATGKNTSKRPGAVEGELLNANSSNNFHPIPLRTTHFASGYCLAICCISSLFDYTPLSKHGVCAKYCHLPFAPLIQPYCVSPVRSSGNSFEKLVWQRFYRKFTLFTFLFVFFPPDFFIANNFLKLIHKQSKCIDW